MKRLILIPVLLMFMFTGCMTDNALKAEQSYYKAISDMQTQKASQPIFELTPAKAGEPITLGNVGSFKVFAPPTNSGQNLSQYVQKDYVQPWLNIVGAAVPWLGVWGVTHAIVGGMKEMGGTSYNQSGTGNKLVGGNLDMTSTPTVVTQPAPLVITQPAPIIVTQPAPLIVNPVLVP